jgi:DNA recombination protein RmuC
MWIAIGTFVLGFLLGAVILWAIMGRQTKNAKALAEELLRDSEARRQGELDRMLDIVRQSFGNLSAEALARANDEFLKLRQTLLQSDREGHARELDAKKGLIDEQLKSMGDQLEKVQRLMKELEQDRGVKFGQLDSSLKSQNEQVQALLQTTGLLREALASTKARGQWGERMAEDVLRLAGFIEGINYTKQKTLASSGSRPDFTFNLPNNLILNMDVKFPLDNYLRFLDSGSDSERTSRRDAFLRDVRNHVRDVGTREYINPEEHTVDYVLLFIPNEQVYAFIHEFDRDLLDESLKRKVIVCSPLTLYAVLAVVRQASDNFAFEQASEQILLVLAKFQKQWTEFLKVFEKLGERLEAAQDEYQKLTTTRRKQLDRVVDEIDDLRERRGLPLPDQTDSQ